MNWVTRENARVDRIACPWLISRFIDPAPRFLFVPARDVLDVARGERAIPFDVPGAELGHHDDRCSFDAFLDRYDLDDPGLAALARIVRGADTGRHDLAPEAAGLYAAASGFRDISRDDHDNMARQFPLYDALYAFCRERSPADARRRRRVLFVCPHGAAKSVVAAAHLERLAAARGLPVRAVAAGLEPDPQLAPAAAAGLAADGLRAPTRPPRPVTLYDLARSDLAVTFGCDLPAFGVPTALGAGVAASERWDDVPAVSDGYPAAREAMLPRLAALLDRIAGAR
jgi:protein-tyrosine-phosphatase